MIITIGREYGSGGAEIGRLVAEQLGIPYYDKEILARASQESGLCEEVFERHDEKATMSGIFTGGTVAGMHLNAVPAGLQIPLNQRVFLAQFDAIGKIASEGDCVIVGRCADYVLREVPGVTHVFLYASTAHRVERIMRVEGVTADEARDLIRKTDKQRKNYYNFFADGNWGMRSNYDIMLRTDDRKPEDVARLIIEYARLNA